MGSYNDGKLDMGRWGNIFLYSPMIGEHFGTPYDLIHGIVSILSTKQVKIDENVIFVHVALLGRYSGRTADFSAKNGTS